MNDHGAVRRRANVDLRVMEGEVRQALRLSQNGQPHHEEAVPAAPRLSAESIKNEYELAARAIESMGIEVKERVDKLEAALKECDADMKLIAEAAAAIRDKGKTVYVQIEEASALSKEIRDTIKQAREKVGV